ncbi:nuclease-related domain-containing protein [Bacillus sp. EB600]|uniref:nuclease-related domain-containing protein n=1 Tax=Bacillus sp. EB600 TaxID=2806345 RepID=UPI00210C6590|nr:nuclease-related domain-containing protein [Bacillus sp. EB600]
MQERQYPLRAILAKISLMRLPLNHYKRPPIEEMFHREDAGYWGEKALDYYLSFLPNDKYYIFQHLRLTFEKWTFQIDFLLLTKNFALIIEAKNYKGNLHFESKFNQVIQTQNDKEKSYDDPLSQAQRQKILLSKWLKKYTSIELPIQYLVVMSNPNALLKTDPDNTEVLKRVCKPFKLLDKIKEIEATHQTEIMTEKELRKTSRLLVKNHVPEQFNILKYFKIAPEEILTGVRCESCGKLPMEYNKRKWYCPSCHTYSKTAHIESVNDYFLLTKDTITNSEFRDFLHLQTKDIAQKLLLKMNLPSTGNTKARVYHKKELT